MNLINRRHVLMRRYYRVSTDLPVEFSIMRFQKRNVNHLDGKKGKGLCRDIGEDGLSFISPLSLPGGMLLRITIKLSGENSEKLLARVLRCTPVEDGYLTAVQFFNFHGQRRERLRDYLANQARKNYRFLSYI